MRRRRRAPARTCSARLGPCAVAGDRAVGARRARVRAVDAGARRPMGELRLRLGRQAQRRAASPPSVGENFWHATGALQPQPTRGSTFGDERAERAHPARPRHAVTHGGALRTCGRCTWRWPPADRATRARADLEPGGPPLGRRDRGMPDEGDVLMNNPDERGTPHLWAHIQEGVLADAGALLEEPALVEAARRERRSAAGADRARSASIGTAPRPTTCRARCSGSIAWRSRPATPGGRAGRRRARVVRRPEPCAGRRSTTAARGRVADGVDDGRVSANSGAEANIEAAGALRTTPSHPRSSSRTSCPEREGRGTGGGRDKMPRASPFVHHPSRCELHGRGRRALFPGPRGDLELDLRPFRRGSG